jgi:hypothetical protein
MITILDSTIEVLEMLLVLDLSIPLLLYVALSSLSLLAARSWRWGPGAPESTSPVGSWSADLSRQPLRWLGLSDNSSKNSSTFVPNIRSIRAISSISQAWPILGSNLFDFLFDNTVTAVDTCYDIYHA